MPSVPLQRAFDLSVGFTLTLRSGPSPLTPEEIAAFRAVPVHRFWRPSTWFRRPRPVPPSPTQSFEVPPLTLGRFLDLMATNWAAVSAALLASRVGEARGASQAEVIGRQLAGVDHRSFTELACAVVPGLTRETWEEFGSTVEAYRLVAYFERIHDWGLIANAIGWGQEAKEPTTRGTVTTALLSFCQAFPSYSLQELLATRVEGFFYLRDSATRLLSPEKAEDADILAPGGPIIDGAGLIHDPEKKSSLWASISAAEKAVN